MPAPRLGARHPFLKTIAWLLTPVVAWAVSLCAAWVGARIGQHASSFVAGVSWLGGGAVVGAVLGVVGWLLVVRWWFRPDEPAEPSDAD